MRLISAAGSVRPGSTTLRTERAGIGRAAGFGKAGGKRILRQRAPFGVLRNGPLRLADVAVGILHGEHGILPVRDDGVKIHRHALGLEIFIGRAGGGKQLAVRPLRLAQYRTFCGPVRPR